MAFSTFFIISVEGQKGATLRETQRNILTAFLEISHDINDTSVEYLSESKRAQIINMFDDIPSRFTLVHAYIHTVSGYTNLTKPGKRISFVIRVAHNMDSRELAQTISVDLEEEIGTNAYCT